LASAETRLESKFRQIVKHSAIFGLGHVVFRLTSVILLPIYTRFLSPADYGIMALLDLTINLLAIVANAGTAAAASRAHFDDDTEAHRDRVWWTAVGIPAAFTTLIAAPAFALRGSLARLALGAEVANGGYLFALATCSLWVGSMDMTLEQYLRALKVSKLIV